MLRSKFVRTLLFSTLLIAAPVASQAGVFLSITVAPPVLPVYVQPACPGDGYLWTPGYWAYGDAGYYWVPGTWLTPPRVGVLWTPGYWGWGSGFYRWNAGYWGPHVGFYGGVNYGFGYGGVGFFGGMWDGGRFRYNTAVTNVNVNVVHNTYINNVTVVNNNRASFNGPNGISARPTPQEQTFAREQHIQPTGVQVAHEQTAAGNHALLASVNHGNIAPSVAAVPRPLGSAGHNAAGPVNRPAGNPQAARAQASQPQASHPQPFHPQTSHPQANAQSRPQPQANREASAGRQFGNGGHPAAANHPAPAPRQAPHPQGGERPASHPGGGEHEKH